MKFNKYHLIVSSFNANGLILISKFHIYFNPEKNIKINDSIN